MNELAWALIGFFTAAMFGNWYFIGAKANALGDRLESRIDLLEARLIGRLDVCEARSDALLDRKS